MALEINNEFTPRANVPSAEYPTGSIKGESVSGANDGTLLKAILINDYVGFTDALLAEADMTSNGVADTALSSQRLDAIKSLISTTGANRYTDNMINLQQLVVENEDGDALPENGSTIDYVGGDEIALGWSADGAVTGVTKDTFENVKGSGLIYTEITIPDNISLSDLFASVMTASATGYAQTYADGVKVLLTEPVPKTARLTVNLTELTEGFEIGGISQQIGRIASESKSTLTRKSIYNAGAVTTGSATFDNATQAITMTGVGAMEGLELGDVLKVSGSDFNDKLFTLEGITDDNNIVVNYEHRSGSTIKSLSNETATGDVTITLFCKWYNVAQGLGQGWCSPASSRNKNVNYYAPVNRSIVVSIRGVDTAGVGVSVLVDDVVVDAAQVDNLNATKTQQATAPTSLGGKYSFTAGTSDTLSFKEFR